MIASGAMTEIGLAKIEKAKLDGSWNALDASDNLEIAEDLQNAFDANKRAETNFHAFPDGAKKVILSWVNAAKRDETRKARIEKLVAMAEKNRRVNFDKE